MTSGTDKGYNDQELRAMLQRMKVRPLIQHRVFKPHDRASNARMDQRLYRRRSLLESVNSVVKRKYGGWVRSRVWGRRFREIEPKICYKQFEQLDGEKQTLVDRVGNGSIISRFNKTALPEEQSDIICPHFLELKWAYGCPFDCSWCYLKGTFRFRPEGTKPKIKDFKIADSPTPK